MNRPRMILRAGLLLLLAASLTNARSLSETKTIRDSIPIAQGQQLIVDRSRQRSSTSAAPTQKMPRTQSQKAWHSSIGRKAAAAASRRFSGRMPTTR